MFRMQQVLTHEVIRVILFCFNSSLYSVFEEIYHARSKFIVMWDSFLHLIDFPLFNHCVTIFAFNDPCSTIVSVTLARLTMPAYSHRDFKAGLSMFCLLHFKVLSQ